MSLNNVLARTDGALFSGPTFHNTILDPADGDSRSPDPPEWLPIYDDGKHVRFVAPAQAICSVTDALGQDAGWSYLQHASDPIAWWTPDLLFSRPDWLRKNGLDSPAQDTWIPVVTFLQVSADMAVRGRRAGRTWSPLCRRRGRRLGRCAVAARLDAGENRQTAATATHSDATSTG